MNVSAPDYAPELAAAVVKPVYPIRPCAFDGIAAVKSGLYNLTLPFEKPQRLGGTSCDSTYPKEGAILTAPPHTGGRFESCMWVETHIRATSGRCV
jgi:hypothetical protein